MSNCDVALFVWNRISVAGTQVFATRHMNVFYFNFYLILLFFINLLCTHYFLA